MSADTLTALRQRHNQLVRHHGREHPTVIEARRQLALARTVQTVRHAIEQAPPLDSATLAQLRALIPPRPAGGGR